MKIDHIDKTKNYFNKKKSKANSSVSPIMKFVYDEICNTIPINGRGGVALDVGCHWGKYTSYLSKNFDNVYGVDFSDQALKSAEIGDNIQYICADMEKDVEALVGKIPPVDLVAVICVFEMVRSPSGLSVNLFRFVQSGGLVFAVIPNRHSLNYYVLRILMWIGNQFFGKEYFIWNNKIEKAELISVLSNAGFRIDRVGGVVGLPVYLIDRFPFIVQRVIIKLDKILKVVFRSAYIWVVASKP